MAKYWLHFVFGIFMDHDSTIPIKKTHEKEFGQYQAILNSLYLVILPTDAAPQFL